MRVRRVRGRAGGRGEGWPGVSRGVCGTPPATIGELVLAVGVALHELSPQTASLEEAYMELVKEDVEFVGATS